MWSSWWSLLVLSYIVVSNATVIDSAVIVCPNDRDCVVNCTSSSRNCRNAHITCPKSNTSSTYTCTILCFDTFSCVGTTIDSTHAVSTFLLQAMDSNACENTVIQANGTEKIVLSCGGANGCTHSNLTSRYAKSVELWANRGTSLPNTAFYAGMLNISHTPNVALNCGYWGCSDNIWIFNDVKNVDLNCANYSACLTNSIEITKSTNVTIEATVGTKALSENQINVSKVENLVLKVSDGTASGAFSLMDITNFLYVVENTGETLFTWVFNNVSNIALNTWDATSFWIVDGRPIQKEYTCPNGQDCNIRVDANLSSPLPIRCPKDIGTSRTTCNFYCSSIASGCGAVNLTVEEVVNAALYFSIDAKGLVPFSVYPKGLTNVNSTINITCGYQSCMFNKFNVSRYDYVNLIAMDSDGYSFASVNVTEFYKVTVNSVSQGFQDGDLTLTDGEFVNLVSSPGLSNIYLGSNWLFNNTKHVAIECLNTIDCYGARFNAVEVDTLTIQCGTPYIKSTTNCWRTEINLLQEASLNLTCRGIEGACQDMIIRYNGSVSDKTSCALNCMASPLHNNLPNCENITIEVIDNKKGFDAISFYCDTDGDNSACQDVYVSCGIDGTECRCPVDYDNDDDDWYCDGTCGTSTCPYSGSSSSSSKKTTEYIIIAVVSVVALVAIVIIAIVLRKKYCNKNSFQPLLDDSKHIYTH